MEDILPLQTLQHNIALPGTNIDGDPPTKPFLLDLAHLPTVPFDRSRPKTAFGNQHNPIRILNIPSLGDLPPQLLDRSTAVDIPDQLFRKDRIQPSMGIILVVCELPALNLAREPRHAVPNLMDILRDRVLPCKLPAVRGEKPKQRGRIERSTTFLKVQSYHLLELHHGVPLAQEDRPVMLAGIEALQLDPDGFRWRWRTSPSRRWGSVRSRSPGSYMRIRVATGMVSMRWSVSHTIRAPFAASVSVSVSISSIGIPVAVSFPCALAIPGPLALSLSVSVPLLVPVSTTASGPS